MFLCSPRRGATIAAVIVAYVAYRFFANTFDEGCLRGKRVLVTGASTGIGEQLAYQYARMGAKLVITARREARLQQVIARCRDVGTPGGQYEYFVADMSKEEDAKPLIDFAVSSLGGLDVLVLNHMHILPDIGSWMGSRENFTLLNTVMTVNFLSYVRLASQAMTALESSNGSLVVISSLSGKLYQPYFLPYSTSKYALNGFFGGLRQELKVRRTEVSVTTCSLGFIDTENAITSVRRFGLTRLVGLSRADVAKTAEAIVRGAATRADDLYVPYAQARFVPIVHEIIPTIFDAFIRYIW